MEQVSHRNGHTLGISMVPGLSSTPIEKFIVVLNLDITRRLVVACQGQCREYEKCKKAYCKQGYRDEISQAVAAVHIPLNHPFSSISLYRAHASPQSATHHPRTQHSTNPNTIKPCITNPPARNMTPAAPVAAHVTTHPRSPSSCCTKTRTLFYQPRCPPTTPLSVKSASSS